MLNQVVLVGRLVKNPELVKGENGSDFATLTLAIPRSWKNGEGLYDTDFIKCQAFENIASNTAEYCKKGDIVGVKGRLQNNNETDYKIEIIAEKITFLSSKSE